MEAAFEVCKNTVIKLARSKKRDELADILQTQIFQEPFIPESETKKFVVGIVVLLLEHNVIVQLSQPRLNILIADAAYAEIFVGHYDPSSRTKVSQFTMAWDNSNLVVMTTIWRSFTANQKASYRKKFATKPTTSHKKYRWLIENDAIPDFGGICGEHVYWYANFHHVPDLTVSGQHLEHLHTFKYQSTKFALLSLAEYKCRVWRRQPSLINSTHRFSRSETMDGKIFVSMFGNAIEPSDATNGVPLIPFSYDMCLPHKEIHRIDDQNLYTELLGKTPIYTLLYAAVHCNRMRALVKLLDAPESVGVDTIYLLPMNDYNECVQHLLDRCVSLDHYRRLGAFLFDAALDLVDVSINAYRAKILISKIHPTPPKEFFRQQWLTLNEPDCYAGLPALDEYLHIRAKYAKMVGTPYQTLDIDAMCSSNVAIGQFADGGEYGHLLSNGDIYVRRDGTWVLLFA